MRVRRCALSRPCSSIAGSLLPARVQGPCAFFVERGTRVAARPRVRARSTGVRVTLDPWAHHFPQARGRAVTHWPLLREQPPSNLAADVSRSSTQPVGRVTVTPDRGSRTLAVRGTDGQSGKRHQKKQCQSLPASQGVRLSVTAKASVAFGPGPWVIGTNTANFFLRDQLLRPGPAQTPASMQSAANQRRQGWLLQGFSTAPKTALSSVAWTPQFPSTTWVTPKSTATDIRDIASSSLSPCVVIRK